MLKILLGDDDKNFGMVLKMELEDSQYQVDLLSNGVDLVLSFLAAPYHFVLLDIRMPRMNGNDALRIIKQINPRVPVITFSGNADSGDMEESVRCGAVKCLRKPFEIEQLKDAIRTHIVG
jgi:two-component system, response regulator, stage 0 sporulation protein F